MISEMRQIALGPELESLIRDHYSKNGVIGISVTANWQVVNKIQRRFGISVDRIMRGMIPSDDEKSLSLYRVCVYIDESLPEDEKDLLAREIPPLTDSGLPVTPVFVGKFSLQSYTGRDRPIVGGLSIGSVSDPYSGTLGGVVRDIKTGDNYIMTCGHVIQTLTDIAQPGISDGGSAARDSIAGLPIHIERPTYTSFGFGDPYHRVDAAIAKLKAPSRNSTRVIGGKVRGVRGWSQGAVGDLLSFVGKESDDVYCVLSSCISRVKIRFGGIDYNFGDIFEISARSTLYIGSLSSPGDSGAWVLHEVDNFGPTYDVYGMLVAGNKKTSLCAFAEHVFRDLGAGKVDLVI